MHGAEAVHDLERRGGKQMFITEEVASINKNKNGLWTVRFLSSPVCSQLQSLQTALPHALQNDIDIGKKGLYVKNRHIMNVSELLRFTDGRHTFYRVTYINGYCENLDGN